METLLLLTHTEPDGSLAKPALEALSAAKVLSDSLTGSKFLVGFIGENVQPTANQIAGCGAARFIAASGNSMLASVCAGRSPSARAASRSPGPTSRSPACVLRTMGRSA